MTNFTVGNNIQSLVTNNPLSSSGSTLNVLVGAGSDFPSEFPYRLTIWGDTYTDPSDDPNTEIVECTARSGDTLTISRAKENTNGVQHAYGSYVAMLITAGLFNDSDYGILSRLSDKQSFTNLLDNGDFESWNAGTTSAPDKWTYYQNGSGGAVARSTDEKIGTYSSQITKSSGSISRLRQSLTTYNQLINRKVSFGCWVKSANTVTNGVYMYMEGDIDYIQDIYQNSGDWEWLECTSTVNLYPGSINVNIRLLDTANAVAYFDGAILVEGSVCPAFSLKPMPNPSLITSAPSDTGYDGEIRIYSSGGVRRLYISDGSDWKYQVIST